MFPWPSVTCFTFEMSTHYSSVHTWSRCQSMRHHSQGLQLRCYFYRFYERVTCFMASLTAPFRQTLLSVSLPLHLIHECIFFFNINSLLISLKSRLREGNLGVCGFQSLNALLKLVHNLSMSLFS